MYHKTRACAPLAGRRRGLRPATSWPAARALIAGSALIATGSSTAFAQSASSPPLDSLIAIATVHNPAIRAANARTDAAEARVGSAGARSDPMLMAGVQNFPVSEPGFSDFMTMKMIGISQTIPFPGKLARRTEAAKQEADASRAAADAVHQSVVRDVRLAYYDLAFAARALDVVARTEGILAGMIPVTEARYSAGRGTQTDVLRLRIESARLANEAAGLVEERRATVARINALLDRPADTPVGDASIPERIARAAVADSGRQITFASAALGARVTGSPLPSLDSVTALALLNSPSLRERAAMIAAQAARAASARRDHLPDFDIALQYGQRNGFPDMVTATVSVPIPLQKHRKQDAETLGSQAELRTLEAERENATNELRADLARLHGTLERDRTQLALYVKAVLPQARAALASTSAAYQSGRGDFTSLIDTQATLFTYETEYYRALTDFAKTLAELEERVGTEVIK
jgi:cobalt-zinc-cadmium efflux system outer membrane protein